MPANTIEQFIACQVSQSATALIEHLYEHETDATCRIELDRLCRRDDWITAAEDEGARLRFDKRRKGWRYGAGPALVFATAEEAARAFCEHHGAGPYAACIPDHWVVSGWMAEQLAARGETVSSNVHGLSIWSRDNRHQTLEVTAALRDIYADSMALASMRAGMVSNG